MLLCVKHLGPSDSALSPQSCPENDDTQRQQSAGSMSSELTWIHLRARRPKAVLCITSLTQRLGYGRLIQRDEIMLGSGQAAPVTLPASPDVRLTFSIYWSFTHFSAPNPRVHILFGFRGMNCSSVCVTAAHKISNKQMLFKKRFSLFYMSTAARLHFTLAYVGQTFNCM